MMGRPIEGPYEYDEDTQEITVQGAHIASVANVDDFPCLDPEENDMEALEAEYHATGRLLAAAPAMAEEIGRLRAVNAELLDACRTMMGGTDLITRWPCPDCGRKGPDEPKRLIHARLEDGDELFIGCWRCNTDVHRDVMRDAIARATSPRASRDGRR